MKTLLSCGAAALIFSSSVSLAAPAANLTPLAPLDVQARLGRAYEKTAAFGGDRWLAVYANSRSRLAGAWLTSDGEPIGRSFPLFGDVSGARPQLVHDGRSFVLARVEEFRAGVKLTRIDTNDIGPDIEGPSEIGGLAGFHTGPALAVDVAGTVHVADCITISGQVGAWCSISSLSADALVLEATFTVPITFTHERLQLEANENGFLLFMKGNRAGISVVHVDRSGTASDPLMLSTTSRWLSTTRLGAYTAVAWTELTGTPLQLALLDANGQVVSTQPLAWDIDPLAAPQLAPASGGLVLVAKGPLGVLIQLFDANLQAISAQRALAPGNASLFLASDDERVLVGWNSTDRYSLQAAVVDPLRLDGESPVITDLSYEVLPQGAIAATTTPQGWLAIWETEVSERDASPRLVELRGRLLDARGTALSDPFRLLGESPAMSLVEASGGPLGSLVTWLGAGQLNATFVPTGAATTSTESFGSVGGFSFNRSSQLCASPNGGWLLARATPDLHSLLANRIGPDGRSPSPPEVIATDELIGLLPTDEKWGLFGFTLTANEQGFLLVWGAYAERAYPPNEFGFTSMDFALYSRLLDDDGKPRTAQPQLLEAWHTDRPGRDRFDALAVAATGQSAWLGWRNIHSGFFSALPLSASPQALGSAEFGDFLGVRAVAPNVVAVWAAYSSAFVALAEPGGELSLQPLLGARPRSLSEARSASLAGSTAAQTLLIGTNVSDDLYGGATERVGLTLLDVIPGDESTGGGGAGGAGGADGGALGTGGNHGGQGGNASGGFAPQGGASGNASTEGGQPQEGGAIGNGGDDAGRGGSASGGRCEPCTGGVSGGLEGGASGGESPNGGASNGEGCDCRLAGSKPSRAGFWLALLALGLLAWRRVKARSSPRWPCQPRST